MPADNPAGASAPAPTPNPDGGLAPTPDALARAIVDNLFRRQGRVAEFATTREWYAALALTVRDRLIDR